VPIVVNQQLVPKRFGSNDKTSRTKRSKPHHSPYRSIGSYDDRRKVAKSAGVSVRRIDNIRPDAPGASRKHKSCGHHPDCTECFAAA
jgi:hypothetical protein